MHKLAITELRPTQFALGMREVEHKAAKISKMHSKELEQYLQSMPVPIVLAPKGRRYLIDHHHLARAAWETGVKELFVEVKADFSGLAFEHMWRTMKEANWVYLIDQLGGGPHDPIELPESIRGLADDPYRSVSWRVRNDGGYQKNPAPFSEFRWAEYFRKALSVHPVHDEFEHAVTEALHLARSPAAAHLPGHTLAAAQAPVAEGRTPLT